MIKRQPIHKPLHQFQTHPQTDLSLKMDYKVILESQYITKRMCEIANRPLEIGFVYGGTVTQSKTDSHSHTTIDMKQVAIPTNQRVTPTTFDFESNVVSKVESYFQERDLQIVGQGHSHQHMDVFHSPTDLANYKKMTLYCGTKISPHVPKTVHQETKQYNTFSRRLKKTMSHVKQKYISKSHKPKYVFPTLVFNTKGDITQGLAINDLKKIDVIEDIPIQYYNKQAILTIEDKQRLDRRIYAVLKENNIPYSLPAQIQKQPFIDVPQQPKRRKTLVKRVPPIQPNPFTTYNERNAFPPNMCFEW